MISENTKVTLKMVSSILAVVAGLIWGYFLTIGNIEQRVTRLETTVENSRLHEIPAALARIEGKLDEQDKNKD